MASAEGGHPVIPCPLGPGMDYLGIDFLSGSAISPETGSPGWEEVSFQSLLVIHFTLQASVSPREGSVLEEVYPVPLHCFILCIYPVLRFTQEPAVTGLPSISFTAGTV